MGTNVNLSADFDSEELAQQIVNDIHDHDDILEFVLAVDNFVEDEDFTVALRDKLTEALKAEDAAHDAMERENDDHFVYRALTPDKEAGGGYIPVEMDDPILLDGRHK